MTREGQIRNKFESLAEKRMQSEIPLGLDKDDHDWLKCNTDSRKTASIFTLQEQMIETKAWKKLRGLADEDKCRLWGTFRENIDSIEYFIAEFYSKMFEKTIINSNIETR